jgi:hypothetical protein
LNALGELNMIESKLTTLFVRERGEEIDEEVKEEKN